MPLARIMMLWNPPRALTQLTVVKFQGLQTKGIVTPKFPSFQVDPMDVAVESLLTLTSMKMKLGDEIIK